MICVYAQIRSQANYFVRVDNLRQLEIMVCAWYLKEGFLNKH